MFVRQNSWDSRVSVSTNELGIKKGKTLKKAKSMVSDSHPQVALPPTTGIHNRGRLCTKASEAEDVPAIRPSNPKMPGGWPTSSPKPADSDKTPTLVTNSSGAVNKSMTQGQQSNRSSTDTVRRRPSRRVVATSTSSLPQSLEQFPPFEDSTGQQQLADSGFEQTPSDICVRLPSNPDMPTHMYRHPLMKASAAANLEIQLLFSRYNRDQGQGEGSSIASPRSSKRSITTCAMSLLFRPLVHSVAQPSFLKEIDHRLRNLPTLQTSSTLSTLASLLTKEPLPQGKTLRHTTLPKSCRWASLETDISSGQELLEQAELKKRLLKRAGATATTKEEQKAWGDLSSEFSQSVGSLARELGVNSQSLPASSSSIPPPVPPRTARRQPSKKLLTPILHIFCLARNRS